MIGSESRDYEKVLKDYLPSYYYDIKEVMEVIKDEATEFQDYQMEIEEVLNQFYVDRATWGLEKWEEACGITTDETKTLLDRRGAIKTKIKGIGTVTVERLKNLADSFYNTEIKEDTANYRITIMILGIRGVPTDITVMQKALREMVPAHLAVDFVFTYVTWDELEYADKTNGVRRTWRDIAYKDDGSRRTWNELETTFFNGEA
jgi:hypothetical protein